MPRVCGENPYRFSGHGPVQDHVVGKFISRAPALLEPKNIPEIVRNIYNPKTGSYKVVRKADLQATAKYLQKAIRIYRSGLNKALKSRPCIRPRKSGVVGPEPDFSIVYSDVSKSLVNRYFPPKDGTPNGFALCEDGSRMFPDDPIREENPFSRFFGPRISTAEKDCIATHMMGLKEILEWTSFAYRNGITFHGDRGYRFSGNRGAVDIDDGSLSYLAYMAKKEAGYLSHRRSDLAKIRRAAARAKVSAVVKPLPAGNLFCTRYRMSSKELSRSWHSLPLSERCSYRTFKESVGTNLTLFPRCCHGTVPPLVFSALRRIYSKPVKFWNSRPWFKVDSDLQEVLKIPRPLTGPKEVVLRNRLKAGAIVQRQPPGVTQSSFYSTIPRLEESLYNSLDLIGGSSEVGPSARLASARLASHEDFSFWN